MRSAHNHNPAPALDVQRLRNASPLQTLHVRPAGRRALSKRTVILFLLCVLAVIALITASEKGHAQTIVEPVCYISAPVLPAQDVLNCLQSRVFVPLVAKAR